MVRKPVTKCKTAIAGNGQRTFQTRKKPATSFAQSVTCKQKIKLLDSYMNSRSWSQTNSS